MPEFASQGAWVAWTPDEDDRVVIQVVYKDGRVRCSRFLETMNFGKDIEGDTSCEIEAYRIIRERDANDA